METKMVTSLFFVLGSLTIYFTIDAIAENEGVSKSAKYALLSGMMFVWLGFFSIVLS